jgi:hypothetical protein
VDFFQVADVSSYERLIESRVNGVLKFFDVIFAEDGCKSTIVLLDVP